MSAPSADRRAHLPAKVVAAWQAALASEHRAVFGYGLLGPRLVTADRTRARTDFDAHEDARDATSAALAAAGQTPVGPDADYQNLYPVGSVEAARRLAVTLEVGAASAWRYLYATVVGSAADLVSVRTIAQQNLTACAVRATVWRAVIDPARATVPFPGL